MQIKFVITSKVRVRLGALAAWTGTEPPVALFDRAAAWLSAHAIHLPLVATLARSREFFRTVKHSRMYFGRGMSILTLGRRYFLSLMNAGMSLQLLKTSTAMAAVMLAGVAAASPGEPGIRVCSRMLEAGLPHPKAVALKYRIELL